MIQELTLKNFKSFGAPPTPPAGSVANQQDWAGEKIKLGGLSLIIGTNASGKSNIRDALRLIHGISRGYTLAEILGEKYGEGGQLQWKGIRGGVREIVTRNGQPENSQFTIAIRTQLLPEDGGGEAEYSITVDAGDKNRPPAVAEEWLKLSKRQDRTFDCGFGTLGLLVLGVPRKDSFQIPHSRFDLPALTQMMNKNLNKDLEPDPEDGIESLERMQTSQGLKRDCQAFLRTISSMRFHDLDPPSLRRPCIPGQTTLGDKGENLSSVLQAICKDPAGKEALIAWTRELTPLDVTDIKFPEVSLNGRIQLQLVEHGGREISAESASDGTLRFLAIAGAMLGTEPARFYFFEELENGIHPNRAHLLINLLQDAARKRGIQVVGTTHSPALLNYLDAQSLRDASLVYRAGSVSKIKSFADIPSLSQVTEETRPGELFGSGWFEDVASFTDPDGAQ
jgi:predicted ATPase